MPEHPPCLTPILKQRSSFRSALILFRCFKAFSVNEIAGAILPGVAADAGGAEARRETALPPREPPPGKRIEKAETARWGHAVPGRRPRSGQDVPDASAMVGFGERSGETEEEARGGRREEGNAAAAAMLGFRAAAAVLAVKGHS